MPHSSSHVHDSSGICMAAGAARGLAVEAAGGTAVRAATAEAPREVKANMGEGTDDNTTSKIEERAGHQEEVFFFYLVPLQRGVNSSFA